jgi:hypothetical protein
MHRSVLNTGGTSECKQHDTIDGGNWNGILNIQSENVL